jgi:hypothetical protein
VQNSLTNNYFFYQRSGRCLSLFYFEVHITPLASNSIAYLYLSDIHIFIRVIARNLGKIKYFLILVVEFIATKISHGIINSCPTFAQILHVF